MHQGAPAAPTSMLNVLRYESHTFFIINTCQIGFAFVEYVEYDHRVTIFSY